MKSSHSDDLSNIANQQELDIYQNIKLPTNKNFGDGYLYESFVISYLVDTLLKYLIHNIIGMLIILLK